jgi:hypothetical protein
VAAATDLVEMMGVRWWRLLAVLAAGLLLLAGWLGTGDRTSEPPQTSKPPKLPVASSRATDTGGQLLGAIFREAPASLKLARLDPRSLEPLPGRQLNIPGPWWVLSVAPDRSMAMLGNEASGKLAVVDLVGMRSLGTIRVKSLAWTPTSRWIGRSRLLLVMGELPVSRHSVLLMLDPHARRVLHRQRLPGPVLTSGHLPGGLVLLLAPDRGIGPATLAVVDQRARIRTVTLSEIAVGYESVETGGLLVDRQAFPGLAVDPAGRRAYVVAADAPVAEVDLTTLRVGYHRLAKPTSLLQRLANWLLPPAEAKGVTSGPARRALWLGEGLLAVAGSDAVASNTKQGARQVQRPSGLQLIDTHTWTVHMLDPHTSSIMLADGRLFASGERYDSDDGEPKGYGLTIYGPGDRRPVHLIGSNVVWRIQVHGDLAYVRHGGGYSVVDLRANRVLRHEQRDLPAFLEPDQP